MLEELRRREADRSGLDVILISLWEGDDALQKVQDYCELWGVEGTVLLGRAVHVEDGVGLRDRPEERQALDVVPVQVRQQHAAVEGTIGGKRLPARAQARPHVEDDGVVAVGLERDT